MIRPLFIAACCLSLGACVAPGDGGPDVEPTPEPGADASVQPPPPPPPPPVVLEPSARSPKVTAERQGLSEHFRLLQIEGQARSELLPAGSSTVQDVRTVVLTLELVNAFGPVPVSLELTAPNGMPYQRLQKEVVAEAGSPVAVEFAVPIAGTLIHRASLHGTWSASFEIRGRAIAEATFDLQPATEVGR